MKTPLLIATLVSTGLAATGVEAADDVDGAELPINEIDFGVGYVSDDSWKFGRYNGLYQEGPLLIGDIYTQDINEDAEYWSVRGTNLGLESRYFRLESGTQGKTDFFFEFSQQPNYINNTGETPYLSPGSTQLVLPPGYVPPPPASNVNSYLLPLELKTERQRVGAGLDIKFENYWSFDVAFKHETKDGIDKTGSAIAPIGAASGVVRLATGALIPEPIDYETNLVNAALSYAKDKSQFAIQYNASIFKNANDSLLWQDYYRTTQFGSQSLPPDNQMHQLSLSGGYQMTREYNITGVLSISRANQDQTFQAYDVNGLGGTLPRDSLDGEVNQSHAQFRFTYRPSRKFRLNAEYRYDDRDNNTPVSDWAGVVADGDKTYDYENNPESYTHNKFDLIGNWHIGSITNLRVGYQYDLMYREFASLAEPTNFDTQENTLTAKLKMQPGLSWNLALYGEASDRNLNNYELPPDRGTGIIPFYVADRQHGQLGALVEYMPGNSWNFGARAEYISDDYDEAQLGLVETETPSFTLDASYHPSKDISTYVYYTREEMRSSQKGRSTTAGTVTTPAWDADFDDTTDTFGLGGKILGMGKWDMGLDFTYNKSKGKIDIIDLSDSSTNPYPDLKTELASIKLWTQYNQSKSLAYRFYYWYEDYEADNWAVDGLETDSLVYLPPPPPAPGYTNYLLTGEETLDYKVHVVGISLVYLFP